MGTSFKGMGVFRKEFLIHLIRKFGRSSFSYNEASTVPEFSRAVFMNLYADGMLKKASKELPLRYSISSSPVKRWEDRDSPDTAVESDVAISHEGGDLCSV